MHFLSDICHMYSCSKKACSSAATFFVSFSLLFSPFAFCHSACIELYIFQTSLLFGFRSRTSTNQLVAQNYIQGCPSHGAGRPHYRPGPQNPAIQALPGPVHRICTAWWLKSGVAESHKKAAAEPQAFSD